MTLGTGDCFTAGNTIDPRPILIVTGLVQEARIAAGPGMAVICSSSSPTQLRADFRNVAKVSEHGAAAATVKSFVIQEGQPGLQAV